MTDHTPEPRNEIEISDSDPLHAHPLTAQRLEKVEAIRTAGAEPYPVRFERTATSAELHAEFHDLEAGQETGREVAVAGRVLNLRRLGKLDPDVVVFWFGMNDAKPARGALAWLRGSRVFQLIQATVSETRRAPEDATRASAWRSSRPA